MKIYSCGTIVTPKHNGIEGVISQVSIRFEAVRYEIEYFYEGELKCCWLHESQFDTEGEKKQIGFK